MMQLALLCIPILILVVELDPDCSAHLVLEGSGAIYLEIIRLRFALCLQFWICAFVELASGKRNNFTPHQCSSRRHARQIGCLPRAVAAVSRRLRPARILNDCERRRGPGGYIRSDDGAAVVTAREVLILLGCYRRACQRARGKQHGNNRLVKHGGLSSFCGNWPGVTTRHTVYGFSLRRAAGCSRACTQSRSCRSLRTCPHRCYKKCAAALCCHPRPAPWPVLLGARARSRGARCRCPP